MTGREGEHLGTVDVLVLTALQDELEAVLALGEGGRDSWHVSRDLGGFRYHHRVFPSARGGSFSVAAAWIGGMGEPRALVRGQELLRELDPSCLAMCGICAGYREKVSLGDVIVADRMYRYGDGKRVVVEGGGEAHYHELRTFELEATWRMDAAYLAREVDLRELSRERPPSREAQRKWVLHALFEQKEQGKPAPKDRADRKAACPGFSTVLKQLLSEGLVLRRGRELLLSEAGRDAVEEDLAVFPDGLPPDPPMKVHVGAVAAVSAVVEDPGIFDRLRRLVRGTIGLEMEGPALGELSEQFKKRAILVKAVQDFADGEKDDLFRAFACRASAFFLLEFLKKTFEPSWRLAFGARMEAPKHPRSSELFDEEERVDPFLSRVERIVRLREPRATITRHAAPPPFSGVLELEVPDGAILDVRVIAAVDRPMTEELFSQYLAEVESRYRLQNPYLRTTLVHSGPQAPPALLRDAAFRGVFLKSFAEYQGLIDFRPYLEWQTKRLEEDPIYPPWLYVEQPSYFSLAGSREERRTQSALSTLRSELDVQEHPRFALVLGDFGAGKTFLLHELARRMVKEGHPLVPVLVEMSKLEKAQTLKGLLALHFANADFSGYDSASFQYMLAEGRIALLFDGFDELALRLPYDRAVQHFETVLQAAQGRAKVVVTSRRQHFLNDRQIKLALAERAEMTPGYRLFLLTPFGTPQIEQFLKNSIQDPKKAEERYRLLDEVKDLLGLSHNPRMLGFIAKLDEDKLLQAKAKHQEITAAKLYELLVEQWLEFEFKRANPPGAPRGISVRALRRGMSELASHLWHRQAKTTEIQAVRDCLVSSLQALNEPPIDPAVVEHMFGAGSLLVRDAEGVFQFIHRSVMEWFVAESAAREVVSKGDSAALDVDEMSELMADFFVSMAGKDRGLGWVWDKLGGPADGYAKKNATLARRRIEAIWGRQEEPEVDVPVTIDLEGQDLRGRDFSGEDFSGANLAQADLRGATLVEANLRGASLVGAHLSRANLQGAMLSGADLRGANLSFARLVEAEVSLPEVIEEEKWRGANLVGARGIPEERLEELSRAGAALPVVRQVTPMWTPPYNRYCHVHWSGDESLLAYNEKHRFFVQIHHWEVGTWRLVGMTTDFGTGYAKASLSPDGAVLATISDDGTIHITSSKTGQAIVQLLAFRDGWVAFAPDGRYKTGGNLENNFWHLSGRCRFGLGELDGLRLPDDANFYALPPFPTSITLSRTLTAIDLRLLGAAGISNQHNEPIGRAHPEHWRNRVVYNSTHGVLDRYDSWTTLIFRNPELEPRTRHVDFADRPARISALGETILALSHLDNKLVRPDLVAAAYTFQLDLAMQVLQSPERIPPKFRSELASILDLPFDPATTTDLLRRFSNLIEPSYPPLPNHPETSPPRGLALAGLAVDHYKLPSRVGAALVAATCPTRAPIVRITRDDLLPGLFLLCVALQLWQRPVRVGHETFVELPNIDIEGLRDQKPVKKLTFRFDWRTNADPAVLAKTGFDPKIVSADLHQALDRLRIATDVFPDIRVELRFPNGDETIEIVREAETTTTPGTTDAKPKQPSEKPSTWQEIQKGLEAPVDPAALQRLQSVFEKLPRKDADDARDRLRKVLDRGKRNPGTRALAADLLVAHFYDDPEDQGRIDTLDALLAFSKRNDLDAQERRRAIECLVEIYGGLPVEHANRLARSLEAASRDSDLPQPLRDRINALLARHKKKSQTTRKT